jgi:acetyltransferase-like isoleucine patch superfamily enzyme
MTDKLSRLLRYDWPLHFVLLLTNWLPDNVVFLRWRGAVASPFLRSCGRRLKLGRDVTFYNPSQIHLGQDVYVAKGTWFMAGEDIRVGDEVLIGPYCVLVSSSHTRFNGSFRFGAPERAPVTIGRGCWLAAHVVVTAGATIGQGTLVAAQGVVTGELPCNVLAGGQPATVLKHYSDS